MEIWNLFEYIYLLLVSVTFWCFFYFVKLKMLASRLWKSLLSLTHSSLAFSWEFFIHFSVIWITFIDFITVICSEIPCSIGSGFAETRYLNFLFNSLVTTWYGIWVWGISKQITNSFISFRFLLTCPLLLYSSFACIFSVHVLQTF